MLAQASVGAAYDRAYNREGLAMNVDEWFKQIREKYSGQMQCAKGCTGCCRGLFDITLADVVDVARGFEKLPGDVRREVYSRAEEIHRGILSRIHNRTQPTLFSEGDPLIDEIVDAANSPRCPLLGENGECRIYDHPPLTCRLEGAPMVETHRRLFGDWCQLNFSEGIPETALTDLQLDYAEVDAAPEGRFRQGCCRCRPAGSACVNVHSLRHRGIPRFLEAAARVETGLNKASMLESGNCYNQIGSLQVR